MVRPSLLEQTLYLDTSKASLKAVLLHNSNQRPSIPQVHAVGLKETYESIEKYCTQWNVLSLSGMYAGIWKLAVANRVPNGVINAFWIASGVYKASVFFVPLEDQRWHASLPSKRVDKEKWLHSRETLNISL